MRELFCSRKWRETQKGFLFHFINSVIHHATITQRIKLINIEKWKSQSGIMWHAGNFFRRLRGTRKVCVWACYVNIYCVACMSIASTVVKWQHKNLYPPLNFHPFIAYSSNFFSEWKKNYCVGMRKILFFLLPLSFYFFTR